MKSRIDAFNRALGHGQPVAFDTCAVLYYLGEVAPWFELVDPIIETALDGRRSIHMSSIVQLELLVRPIRVGDQQEAQRVLALTEREQGVVLTEIDRPTLMTAAAIRAHAGLKLGDALIAASAARWGCPVLVGNDKRFRSLNALATMPPLAGEIQAHMPKYIHLDDYVDVA